MKRITTIIYLAAFSVFTRECILTYEELNYFMLNSILSACCLFLAIYNIAEILHKEIFGRTEIHVHITAEDIINAKNNI